MIILILIITIIIIVIIIIIIIIISGDRNRVPARARGLPGGPGRGPRPASSPPLGPPVGLHRAPPYYCYYYHYYYYYYNMLFALPVLLQHPATLRQSVRPPPDLLVATKDPPQPAPASRARASAEVMRQCRTIASGATRKSTPEATSETNVPRRLGASPGHRREAAASGKDIKQNNIKP